MKLLHNWRTVLGKAWSVRLMILAGLLAGIEAVLPFFTPRQPSVGYAMLTFVVVCAALIARFVAQPKMHDCEPRK